MIRQFKVKVNKNEYHVEVEEVSHEIATSHAAEVAMKKMENAVTREPSEKKKPSITYTPGTKCELKAPLPGVITEVIAKEGKTVHAGEKVMVLEAMKMENAILAPATGKVESISVEAGASVMGGQLLLSIVC